MSCELNRDDDDDCSPLGLGEADVTACTNDLPVDHGFAAAWVGDAGCENPGLAAVWAGCFALEDSPPPLEPIYGQENRYASSSTNLTVIIYIRKLTTSGNDRDGHIIQTRLHLCTPNEIG